MGDVGATNCFVEKGYDLAKVDFRSPDSPKVVAAGLCVTCSCDRTADLCIKCAIRVTVVEIDGHALCRCPDR
jgi:hypothetical protein